MLFFIQHAKIQLWFKLSIIFDVFFNFLSQKSLKITDKPFFKAFDTLQIIFF